MIFNMNSGGEAKRCPVLAAAYPADASVFVGTAATFTVAIAQEGKPNAYTYQWYVNGAAVSGAVGPTYTRTNGAVGSFTVHCAVTNKAGTVTSRGAVLTVKSCLPSFTYTGNYQFTNDFGGAPTDTTTNWRLRLLTSGTLSFTSLGTASGIDVFLVGGGGGGGSPEYNFGGGGGGGYTKTVKSVSVAANTSYSIVIGAGGAAYANGGITSAFGSTAGGGNAGGTDHGGGSGGSGGGAYAGDYKIGGAGGSDGSDGVNYGSTHGGTGQHTTTREFGETSGALYAGGGGGGGQGYYTFDAGAAGGAGGGGSGAHAEKKIAATSGTANTGGGGGGRSQPTACIAGSGGSGIVVIRNKR